MIWANLLHLGYNMWWDREVTPEELPRVAPDILFHKSMKPYLRCDRGLWNDITQRMAGAGMNMVVIDLGDGVLYDSHPEIAVENAWTPDELRAELVRLRGLGLEPIPKLNFSTCHDAWLKEYERCVSTPRYYAVCGDLVREVCALFDTPRFFHLGFDEETAQHQVHHEYVAMRQHDLWWHDLLFLVGGVEAAGARAWIWSDYIWGHRDEFLQRMPKSVLQSNWYYGETFDDETGYVRAYLDLDAHGFEQVPTASNWSFDTNFAGTVEFCRGRLDPQRLLGFMQTPWVATLEIYRERHERAVDQVGEAHRHKGT